VGGGFWRKLISGLSGFTSKLIFAVPEAPESHFILYMLVPPEHLPRNQCEYDWKLACTMSSNM